MDQPTHPSGSCLSETLTEIQNNLSIYHKVQDLLSEELMAVCVKGGDLGGGGAGRRGILNTGRGPPTETWHLDLLGPNPSPRQHRLD